MATVGGMAHKPAIPGIGKARELVRFKMCFPNQVNPTDTNNTYDLTCSLNDLSDLTIVGAQQPMGIDEWAAFYQFWRVERARLTIDVYISGSAAVQGFVVGFMPSSDGSDLTGETDWSTWCEYPRMQVRKIAPYIGTATGKVQKVRFSYQYTYAAWKRRIGAARDQFRGLLPHGTCVQKVYGHLLVSRLQTGDIGADLQFDTVHTWTLDVDMSVRQRFLALGVDA